MKKNILLILAACLGFLAETKAQDPQYSQFFASPLLLNPAFAGSTQGLRFSANYRNQWPQLSSQFVTTSASFDYHFANVRSSIGVIARTDQQGSEGNTPINSTEGSLIYSYMIPISERVIVQPALQMTYMQRSLRYNDLIFPDQLNNAGFTGNLTRENIPNNTIGFMDFSTGVVVLSSNFWFGLSAHHLTQPNQSFFAEAQDVKSVLKMKLSAQGGYRYDFSDHYSNSERSITTSFIYRNQSPSNAISIGSQVVLEPITFGVWYRGFPVEQYQSITQQDAFVFMAGIQTKGFSFGYSYDAAISKLYNYNAGAHEISLMYFFGSQDVICPDIYGSGGYGRNPRRSTWRR
ncbi:MAG: type IX secretion system membrane protein PorP/SprF [Cytophagales bacterium]|nr:MAG: type IX secretion system membrane protein PorP/SprF [Cytophagales bacterium]TAF61273.1 MAG: type IX secretion system membrane protein PorP/SprF [Cytophagales bacterium]